MLTFPWRSNIDRISALRCDFVPHTKVTKEFVFIMMSKAFCGSIKSKDFFAKELSKGFSKAFDKVIELVLGYWSKLWTKYGTMLLNGDIGNGIACYRKIYQNMTENFCYFNNSCTKGYKRHKP